MTTNNLYFTKFFEFANQKEFVSNCAAASFLIAAASAVAELITGAALLFGLLTGVALCSGVYFVFKMLLSDWKTDKMQLSNKTETLHDFLEENSFAKAFLEE